MSHHKLWHNWHTLMDAQQGIWIIYNLHGETNLSIVCGNSKQKCQRVSFVWIGHFPFTQKRQIYRKRPHDNEFNLITIPRRWWRTVNGWHIFHLQILVGNFGLPFNYARHSVYFKNFPAGQSKIIWVKFTECLLCKW